MIEKTQAQYVQDKSSPEVSKSQRMINPPNKITRKRGPSRSVLKRLRTEDFSLKRKLQNQSFKTQAKIIIKNIQQRIYILLEDPQSSIFATIIQFILLASITLSCGAIITDSVVDPDNPDYSTISQDIEIYLFVFFSVEYILRLISCTAFNNKISSFLLSPMNFFDILAIFPFILNLLLESSSFKQLRIMRLIRFFRIFRIFKISRFIKNMMLIKETIKSSIKDILVLISMFIVLALLFATIMFYVESNQSDTSDSTVIISITDALWYIIVTMTTVGYGDKIPATVQGKGVACVAAFFGITCISLPVGVMGMNLTKTLRQKMEDDEIKERKKLHAKEMAEEATQSNTDELDQNLKELRFMERRLEELFDNNQRIYEYLQKSQDLFFEVTSDLMSLYQALSEQVDLHFEDRLKNLNAKHKIMKMEKQMKQKQPIELSQLVHTFREKQKLISENSVLNCEESLHDISQVGSFRKMSMTDRKTRVLGQKMSQMSASINNYQRGQMVRLSHGDARSEIYSRSKEHNLSIMDPSQNSKFNIGTSNNILDNIGSNVEFKDDFKDYSSENDDSGINQHSPDPDDCDLSRKVRSMSSFSVKQFKKSLR